MAETETEQERKKRETLEALRRNQTEIPSSTEGMETYFDPQVGGMRSRRILSTGTAAADQAAALRAKSPPSPSPAASPSPSLKPKPKTYEQMSDDELKEAARTNVAAASAWNRRRTSRKEK